MFQYNCCFGGMLRSRKKRGHYNKVSIQLLFRWNNKKIRKVKLIGQFQYNCCFGGIFNNLYNDYTPRDCFNTTVVSVEFILFIYFSICFQFQYNCCFGGIFNFVNSKVTNTLGVSIQLLFRWNGVSLSSIWHAFLFQYNCCFGGMMLQKKKLKLLRAFQYNCCFGGIKLRI